MSSITTDYIGDRVKVDSDTGCWLWQLALNGDGYGVATDNQKYVRAHRLAWELFMGEIPDGKYVLHRCDVRHCVNPDHLFIGTTQDNTADMVSKGRSASGEHHSQARLTAYDAVDIWLSTDSHRTLAKRYGVSRGTISFIKSGKTWQNDIRAIVESKVLADADNHDPMCPVERECTGECTCADPDRFTELVKQADADPKN